MKLKLSLTKKKKRTSNRNIDNLKKSKTRVNSIRDFTKHYNYISSATQLKNKTKRGKSRRNSSLQKNIKIRKSINKIKTNIYNRKNLNSHIDKRKFILPELKNEFKDSFEKHLNSFKSIFGDGKEVYLNYKQFKIFFNQIGIVDKIDENWNFEKEDDETICQIFFKILGNDQINFEFLKLFLILLHQLKIKNTNFKLFQNKKEKKYEILNNYTYIKKNNFLKKGNLFKKKRKKITKKESKSNNKNWDLIRHNFLVESHKSVKEDYNESEKNIFGSTLNYNSKHKNYFKHSIIKKKKEKVLFYAQVNFGDKKEKIYITENDNIKEVAFEFKKKNNLSEENYTKIVKMLYDKKNDIIK